MKRRGAALTCHQRICAIAEDPMSAYTRCDGAPASESTLSHPPPIHPVQPRQIAGGKFLHVQVFALRRHFLGSAEASVRRVRRGQSPSKATISASTRPLSGGCRLIPPLVPCLPSARINHPLAEHNVGNVRDKRTRALREGLRRRAIARQAPLARLC
jgi:hypothetical protein